MRGVRANFWQWRSTACAALVLCVACGGRSALRGRDLEATSGGSGPIEAVGGTLATGAGGTGPGPVSLGGTPSNGGTVGVAGQGGSVPVVNAPDPQRTPPVLCSLDHWCGSNANFVAIWGSSATDIWVIANQTGDLAGSEHPTNSVERSALLHWDGLAWGATQFDDSLTLRAIWGSSKHDVYVVGANNTLQHYDGASWSQVHLTLGAAIDFTSVHGTSAKDVWVVGLSRAALHYDGGAWVTMTPPTMDVFRSVWSSAEDVWVLGDATLNHFDRQSWSTVPRPAAGL